MAKNQPGTIYPIILNQTNLVPSQNNNVYSYQFPGSATLKNAKLALSNIQIYYSWFSIASNYDNNTFSIIVPFGASTTTINITIPDGTYSVQDLNALIQYNLIDSGIGYLVNNLGQYIYYIEIIENASQYSIQLNCYSCLTSLPSGWTNPGSWSLPTTAYTPQLVVPATNFGLLLGFQSGTYPSPQQTSTYSVLSSFTPELSPVSSVVVGASLISNQLSNPQNIIYSFAPNGSTYGQLIQSNAYEYSWITITDGTYPSIDVVFYDQNYNALKINDTNLIIFLLIKFE